MKLFLLLFLFLFINSLAQNSNENYVFLEFNESKLLDDFNNSTNSFLFIDSVVSIWSSWDQNARNEIEPYFTHWGEIDSLNFLRIEWLIKNVHVPSRWINKDIYMYFIVLLIHIDNYEKFNRIDNYLYDAVQKDYLQNNIYAIAKDRSRVHSGLVPYYYEFTKNFACRIDVDFDKLLEKDLLELVNERRNKINLKPLE
jgi:hypothetical protein